MKDFDIVKYLREHQLGSYGILNHYVDLKPLKEESEETELEKTIPYEGPEHQLTGNGGGDEFEQADTISEEEIDHSRIEGLVDQRQLAKFGEAVMAIAQDLDYEGFDAVDIKKLLIDKLNDMFIA